MSFFFLGDFRAADVAKGEVLPFESYSKLEPELYLEAYNHRCPLLEHFLNDNHYGIVGDSIFFCYFFDFLLVGFLPSKGL